MKADLEFFWITINLAVSVTILHRGSSFSAPTEPPQPCNWAALTAFSGICLAQTPELKSGLWTVGPTSRSFWSPSAQYILKASGVLRRSVLPHPHPVCGAPPSCVPVVATVQPNLPPSALPQCDRMSRIYFPRHAWTLSQAGFDGAPL